MVAAAVAAIVDIRLYGRLSGCRLFSQLWWNRSISRRVQMKNTHTHIQAYPFGVSTAAATVNAFAFHSMFWFYYFCCRLIKIETNRISSAHLPSHHRAIVPFELRVANYQHSHFAVSGPNDQTCANANVQSNIIRLIRLKMVWTTHCMQSAFHFNSLNASVHA